MWLHFSISNEDVQYETKLNIHHNLPVKFSGNKKQTRNKTESKQAPWSPGPLRKMFSSTASQKSQSKLVYLIQTWKLQTPEKNKKTGHYWLQKFSWIELKKMRDWGERNRASVANLWQEYRTHSPDLSLVTKMELTPACSISQPLCVFTFCPELRVWWQTCYVLKQLGTFNFMLHYY